MRRFVLSAIAFLSLGATALVAQGGSQPAATAFERLKALDGDWVDVDGFFGTKGAVTVTYRVTGGGTAVIEAFPAGTAEEMVTAYYQDGNDIVLTHYCSAGNQPRMRAKAFTGNALAFAYEDGTNIDPTVTSHMHAMRLELLGPDEIRATWVNWSNGGPDAEHLATFRVTRKK